MHFDKSDESGFIYGSSADSSKLHGLNQVDKQLGRDPSLVPELPDTPQLKRQIEKITHRLRLCKGKI